MKGRPVRPLRVLMVAAECAPSVKVGGLGDAVAGLAAALARAGHDVRVALPRYGHLPPPAPVLRFPLRLRRTVHRVAVGTAGRSGVTIRLLDVPALFGRTGVYGYAERNVFPDTDLRLAAHAQAALLDAVTDGWWPDVVHAHDAAAALALIYLRHWDDPDARLVRAAGVLTIHNLAHQAVQPVTALEAWELPSALGHDGGPLAWYGRLNPMKAGILLADRVTTVSPTYAREVVADPELGAGLGTILAGRGEAFTGIRNGIDTGTWDPTRDPHLPRPVDPGDPAPGRAAAARELSGRLDLVEEADGPLIGMVGRLDHQKGFDLALPPLAGWVRDGARVVLLGTGDPALAAAWHEAAAAHAGRVAFRERFDEALARLIYAGADLLLVPSRFEPCGLVQLYAMRYGAVPVAHRTGGLADTIVDADAEPDRGTGFLFDEATPAALDGAVRRAWTAWRDRSRWSNLQRRAMAGDWSWDGPAAAYADLYREAVTARRGGGTT